MEIRNCPKCDRRMKKVKVSIGDAKNKAVSYQCACGHFEFDRPSSKKVVKELQEKECALNIQQKIIKLSRDRLGIYINSDIVRCLDLKSGQDVYTTVPDKNTIVITLSE